MTIDEFRGMTAEELEGPLLALWWDAQGDWKRAHEVAQDIATLDGSWVHAYLHRKEGDLGNAAYWYARATQPVARGDPEKEWKEIVAVLLSRLG